MNHGQRIKNIQVRAARKFSMGEPSVELSKQGNDYVITLSFVSDNQNKIQTKSPKSLLDAINLLESIIA